MGGGVFDCCRRSREDAGREGLKGGRDEKRGFGRAVVVRREREDRSGKKKKKKSGKRDSEGGRGEVEEGGGRLGKKRSRGERTRRGGLEASHRLCGD